MEFFNTFTADEKPEPFAEIAQRFSYAGNATDPMFGEAQMITVSRGTFDRFVAAAANETGPLANAANALIAGADVADESVDFTVPAFDLFIDAVKSDV